MADQPTEDIFRQLHTTPDVLGTVARSAHVGRLVLSHITPVTDPRIDEVNSIVRAQGFSGKLTVAADLAVYNLGSDDDDGD